MIMESPIADISDLKLEEKYKRFRQFVNTLVALHVPENEDAAQGKFWPEDVKTFNGTGYNTGYEQHASELLEKKIPEVELQQVQVRYIPDYIRELKNKTDYWRKEYEFWNDLISKKNWHKYEKELKAEMIKLKTVIKNLDKDLLHRKKLENHLSQSLDPNRVQTMVDYIKEKENNNRVLEAMLDAAYFRFDYIEVQYAYIQYVRYEEFRLYPSPPISSEVKKED